MKLARISFCEILQYHQIKLVSSGHN